MSNKEDKYYLDRDVSWMYFNRRILQEASKPGVPLLERLSFLGIYSNNLDEFFRVRVASLNRIAECADRALQKESKHAQNLLKQIGKLNGQYAEEYEKAVQAEMADLRKENIFLISDTEATPDQVEFVRSYFTAKLSGMVIPVWFSSIKQLDYESDDSIYLAVKLFPENPTGKPDYAYLGIPVETCGRFVRLPDKEGRSYLMYLDDVVRCSLPLIFRGLGFRKFEAYAFKFTRDAEMEIDNDLRTGTLQRIWKGVKSRKRGEPLRIIYDASMPKDLSRRVLGRLELDKNDTVLKSGRYHNHKDLMKFPDCGRKELKYPAWPPLKKYDLEECDSILDAIRERDHFIHVPYHDFSQFLRVLQEAALSRRVKSIKITLYRLAKDSKVVKALIGAARNGKKVTVVIELLARFDEASNITWSKRMQEAGINVIFGIKGLKVHSKVLYIGMKTGPDVACISTGNFHEGNARAYTDCILMTAAARIVKDVNEVFSFIERPYHPARFRELLVSPNTMKSKFLTLIDNEIKNKQSGKPAYIKAKVNHITDPVMVEKLYAASKAGVKIDLSVRGNCSLITGVPGLSDNIRINGIIDRYLEHSRIFIFAAGGEEKVFMGSADWMPRNLDNRVEVVTPVHDPEIKREMIRIVDAALNDTMQGRVVDGRGSNIPWTVDGQEKPFRSQEYLYNFYKEENEKAAAEWKLKHESREKAMEK